MNYTSMKTVQFLFVLFFLAQLLPAQIVNIPDVNFKSELISNYFINTNFDDEIQVPEALAFTGMINVNNKFISSLTGIEAFKNITHLNCANNSLTNLNVSSNTALKDLFCNNNKITSLNTSSNLSITKLYCHANQLASLIISANTNLIELKCYENYLVSLSLPNSISQLYCYKNQLTNLDVSSCTNLTFLSCWGNQLTNLDVSSCTNLTVLSCLGNQLTSLNVSSNINLTSLTATNNYLTSLDVSSNTLLTALSCNLNQLNYLNVKNGNNSNMTFNAMYNGPLTCIQVDNVSYSNSNWSAYITGNAYFSENCPVGLNDQSNPDADFQIQPNPFSSSFTYSYSLDKNSFVSLRLYDITGKPISILVNKEQVNGGHILNFNGSNLIDGIYYLQLKTDTGIETKKIVKN